MVGWLGSLTICKEKSEQFVGEVVKTQRKNYSGGTAYLFFALCREVILDHGSNGILVLIEDPERASLCRNIQPHSNAKFVSDLFRR